MQKQLNSGWNANRRFRKLVYGGVILAALVAIIVTVSIYRATSDFFSISYSLAQTRTEARALNKLDLTLQNATTVQQGYHPTKQTLANADTNLSAVPAILDTIRPFVTDSPTQTARMVALDASWKQLLAAQQQIAASDTEPSDAFLLNIQQTFLGVRQIVTAMRGEDSPLLLTNDSASAASLNRMLIVLVAGAAIIFLFLALVIYILRNMVQRQNILQIVGEQAMRRSEERYRTLARNFPGGAVFLLDHEMRFEVADGPALQSLGLGAQLEGKMLSEAFPEEGLQALEPIFRQPLTTGQAVVQEVPVQDRTFLLKGVPLKESSDKTTAAMVIALNITEQRKVERAFQASELRFRTSIETLSDGFTILSAIRDANGKIIDFRNEYMNMAAVVMFGTSVEKSVGINYSEIFSGEAYSTIIENFKKVVETGQKFDDVSRIYGADGILLTAYSIRAVKLDDSLATIWRDVSDVIRADDVIQRLNTNLEARAIELELAKKALDGSELRFRTSIETLSDGFTILSAIRDANSTIVDFRNEYMNMAAVVMFGTSVEKSVGINYSEIFSGEAYSTIIENFKRVVETGQKFDDVSRIYGADGILLTAYSIRAVKLDDSLATIWRDVSDATRADDVIQRLNSDLETRAIDLQAANAEMETFSYSVSHDLRAPLRSISGYATILKEDFADNLDPEAKRHLDTIERNARRMGKLIDDLLRFSRLNRQPVSKRTVSSEDMVQQALKTLGDEYDGRQIDVKVGDLPTVEADPDPLQQVYVNLLSNALKYTNKREFARIEVGYMEKDGEEIFFVKDNGAGFDMQYVNKLFGVFQRLHRPQEYEGTGVGLAIVQRIVSRHGGRAWAEGVVDQGATFSFTLKRKPSQLVALPSPEFA